MAEVETRTMQVSCPSELPLGQYVMECPMFGGGMASIPLRREDMLRNAVRSYPLDLRVEDGIYVWASPE